jgi:hypothetical protein
VSDKLLAGERKKERRRRIIITRIAIAKHHPSPLFWYLGFHGNAILNFISMWQLLGVEKFKLVVVAMVTKVQKMLNSLQTSPIFAVMFPVTSTSSGTR